MQWFYMSRFEARVSGGAPAGVLVAARDLQAGESITADVLGVRQIPSAYVELRHILVKDTDVLLGETLSTAIRGGEALLWSDLQLDPTRDAELAMRIRPGMRAITLNAVRDSGLTELLQPGDRVDVLLSSASEAFGRSDAWTRTLLQNVLVLAVGSELRARGDNKDRSARDRRVTVSVTPGDAQRLAQAETLGRISLALRHPDDALTSDGLERVSAQDILALPITPPVTRQRSTQEIEHVD